MCVCVCASEAYHGGANDYEGDRPILWAVQHAYGPLVLCQHIGKGGVDGNGIDRVEAAGDVGDACQRCASQEMISVVVLHHMHTGVGKGLVPQRSKQNLVGSQRLSSRASSSHAGKQGGAYVLMLLFNVT